MKKFLKKAVIFTFFSVLAVVIGTIAIYNADNRGGVVSDWEISIFMK
jgi:hypothetical protein